MSDDSMAVVRASRSATDRRKRGAERSRLVATTTSIRPDRFAVISGLGEHCSMLVLWPPALSGTLKTGLFLRGLRARHPYLLKARAKPASFERNAESSSGFTGFEAARSKLARYHRSLESFTQSSAITTSFEQCAQSPRNPTSIEQMRSMLKLCAKHRSP